MDNYVLVDGDMLIDEVTSDIEPFEGLPGYEDAVWVKFNTDEICIGCARPRLVDGMVSVNQAAHKRHLEKEGQIEKVLTKIVDLKKEIGAKMKVDGLLGLSPLEQRIAMELITLDELIEELL